MTTEYHPLPNRIESELALISLVIDHGQRFLEVCGTVSASDFSQEALSSAWGWLEELTAKNERIGFYALNQHFGGHRHWETFKSLLNSQGGLLNPALPALLQDYARHVVGHSRRDKALRDISRLHAEAEGSRSFEEVADGVQELFQTTCGDNATGGFRSFTDIAAEIDRRAADPKLAPRHRTGFPTLDRMLCKGGMKGGQLVIVAGATGGGKTVLAMNLLVQMALDGVPGAAFSLEMDAVDLVLRCVFSEAVHRSEEEALEVVRRLPIWVDESSNVTAKTISARIKLMAARKGVKVFVVDYLQLIGTEKGARDSRERIVADMSRTLKLAAKENDVTVIALSQVNADGELRESRAIEQDADTVLQIIAADEDEWFLRVCKQRGGASHGPRCMMKEGSEGIPLRFRRENFRFCER